MLVDSRLIFSGGTLTSGSDKGEDTGQVIAADGYLTNSYDLGVSRDLGVGLPLYVVAVVAGFTAASGNAPVTPNFSSSITTQIILRRSNTVDASGNLNNSPVDVMTLGTFGAGAMVGHMLYGKIPEQPLAATSGDTARKYRYIQVYYNITGAPAAGIKTFIASSIPAYTVYETGQHINTY